MKFYLTCNNLKYLMTGLIESDVDKNFLIASFPELDNHCRLS